MLCQFLITGPDPVEIFLFQLLQIQQRVVRPLDDANQFIQFDLYGLGIAILGTLDEEDHEEGYYSGAGVYHELPRIAEVKNRAGDGPHEDDRYRYYKCRGPAGHPRRPSCKATEP